MAGNFHFAPGKSFQQHHVHGELVDMMFSFFVFFFHFVFSFWIRVRLRDARGWAGSSFYSKSEFLVSLFILLFPSFAQNDFPIITHLIISRWRQATLCFLEGNASWLFLQCHVARRCLVNVFSLKRGNYRGTLTKFYFLR